MPQLPVDKVFFSFVGGLNTEVSPLTFPEGTSLDEQNFEMRLNGTRRRRRGLAKESGHTVADVSVAGTYATGQSVNSYRWTNVAGNPDLTFIVVQVGTALLFASEAEDLSPEFKTDYVDLSTLGTTGTDEDIYSYPVDMASGRGFLFVTGRYVPPVYISYDVTTDTFTVVEIPTYMRDFKGIEDGVDLRQFPIALTDDHEYNLINRGWRADLIGTYFTGTGSANYPAKNQIYHKGYRRATAVGYADIDGIKEFNSDKLDAEAFGDSSAPTGALVIDPFDPTYAKLASGTLINISSFTATQVSGTLYEIDITTASNHGLAAGANVAVTNNRMKYTTDTGSVITGSLDGTYVIQSVPAATRLVVNYYFSGGWSAWVDQYVAKGQVATEVLFRSDATGTLERPQAVAFFAGRTWYAGTADDELNDTIFFSQIAVNPVQFGSFYQAADPTSEFINALTPSDGGTIIVPNLGQVYKMIPMEDSLVIFAANGVWAILPSSQGGFRADGYSVRKISDVGCCGHQAVCRIESTVTFCSLRGIYVLGPDQNSGQLNANSITETTIQSLWNEIPDARKREIQVAYDDAKKRVYYLYGTSEVTAARTYDAALVYDARLGAFSKYIFSHSDADGSWKIRGIVAQGMMESLDSAKKMKWLATKDDTGIKLNVLDMDQTGYDDFDGTEQDAYIITGYDNLGDFARHRQAPVVHVYLHKTETGYEEAGDGALTPVGESSCFMQARWDWSDSSNSGKFGTEQEVYRHVKYYQPASAADTFDSGLPVIVTRNKLRGRGRCLHLRFRAGEGKDCYILGWSIEYKGEARQ